LDKLEITDRPECKLFSQLKHKNGSHHCEASTKIPLQLYSWWRNDHNQSLKALLILTEQPNQYALVFLCIAILNAMGHNFSLP